MGVREAATIFMPAGVAEVKVSDFDEQDQLSVEYVKVPELFVEAMNEEGAQGEVIGTGVGIWQQFINAVFHDPVSISPEQVPAFAAALEYAAKKALGIPVTQKSAAEHFETTLGRFRRAEKLLYDHVVRPLEKEREKQDETDRS